METFCPWMSSGWASPDEMEISCATLTENSDVAAHELKIPKYKKYLKFQHYHMTYKSGVVE